MEKKSSFYTLSEQLSINSYLFLYFRENHDDGCVFVNGKDGLKTYLLYRDSVMNSLVSVDELESLYPVVVQFLAYGKSMDDELCTIGEGEYYVSIDWDKGYIRIREKDTEIIECANIAEYLEKVHGLYKGGMNIYFRGQALNYLWLPSLYRNREWIENEKEIILKVLSRHVDEFSSFSTMIEKSIKLKHYNIPSRLLDVVASPLTALFFACDSSRSGKDDAIVTPVFSYPSDEKYTLNSDTVTMLSNLSNVDYGKIMKNGTRKEKQRELLGELGYQCQKECKIDLYWDDIGVEDIDRCILIHPEMNNTRIIQQQGLFILCGFSFARKNTLPDSFFSFFRNIEGKRIFFTIPHSDIEPVMKELDSYGINQSSMYFDLEKTIEYERDKVLR